MRTVEVDEMQSLLENETGNTVLINVLPSAAFDQEHIPSSINIPLESEDFVNQVKNHVHDRNAPIITYCSGPACPASKDAAEKLEESDFTNVMHFKGGMEEWKKAGQEVETGV